MTALALNQQVRNWGVAVRAYSYPASIVPVLLGSIFAWYEQGSFNWLFFLLAMVAGMLYHTGSNLVNDYYDYKHKVDRDGTFGGSGQLVRGVMTPRQFAIGSAVTLGAGTLIGLFFLLHFHGQYPFGWPLLAIGAFGLLGAIFYTATPLSAKYNALGEPLVFLTMGTGMVLGAYFVQAGTLTWNAVWISLPVAFLVAAILQGNDTRDISDDRESKITTASTLLGPTGARVYFTALTVLPYLCLPVLAFFGVARWPVLLPLLTIPLMIPVISVVWRNRDERHDALAPMPEITAKLHLAFGVLMSIGVVLGRWF